MYAYPSFCRGADVRTPPRGLAAVLIALDLPNPLIALNLTSDPFELSA